MDEYFNEKNSVISSCCFLEDDKEMNNTRCVIKENGSVCFLGF